MNRYLQASVQELLTRKMVLVMGPRQVGKTTLSKQLNPSCAYYNYDIKRDLKIFRDLGWDRSKKLIVFDELHKMKNWKRWLKGLFDDGAMKQQQFLITGSARLDSAKKVGDSLAGRFFSVRMNPLDLKELKQRGDSRSTEQNYQRLLTCSGFPEPFFEGTEKFYHLWAKTHSELILRQDLISLEVVRDLDGIETLIELLAERVGSTVSYNALSEDLQRDDKTVKRWLGLLEQMYIVFRVSPYSKNITRGLKKAGKYYFYDLSKVEGGEAQKLENLVALSLKKELEFREDTDGIPGQIYFIQTKEMHEIDFLVLQKKRPARLFEVKLSDERVSKNFSYFEAGFPKCQKIQLVRHLTREYASREHVQVRNALSYLESFEWTCEDEA